MRILLRTFLFSHKPMSCEAPGRYPQISFKKKLKGKIFASVTFFIQHDVERLLIKFSFLVDMLDFSRGFL